MLNEKSLNLAGWLSVVAAALYFPQLIISLISGMSVDKSTAFLYLEALFNAGFAVIYVFLSCSNAYSTRNQLSMALTNTSRS